MAYLKNADTISRTWLGQKISASAYYHIQEIERIIWSHNPELLTSISAGDAVVAQDDSGNTDFSDTTEAVKFLQSRFDHEVMNYHVRITVEDTPEYFYSEVQTDIVDDTIVDPAQPGISVRDFCIKETRINVQTCVGNSPSNLKIRTNVGSAAVDDDYIATNHATLKKWFMVSLVRNISDGLLEILVFEKTNGDYADTPATKLWIKDLKEFSVVAAGTVLVEERTFI